MARYKVSKTVYTANGNCKESSKYMSVIRFSKEYAKLINHGYIREAYYQALGQADLIKCHKNGKLELMKFEYMT